LIDHNQVFIFSLPDWKAKIDLVDVPTTYDELKEFLRFEKSKIGKDTPMEGIVWHHPDGSMVKIKRKDFDYN